MTRRRRWGRVFVISAPSGTGKTTLARRLARECPELVVVRSCTTRPPRPGERDGVDYDFVSPARFDRMVRDGRFLEWAEVYGNRYGTPASAVESAMRKGRPVVLTIDTQGGLAVRKAVPSAVLIGILPPSVAEQEERIRRRKDTSEAEIQRRIEAARRERAVLRKEYDFRLVNRNLDRILERLKRIIRSCA